MTIDYALMRMPVAEIGRALACSGDREKAAVLNAMAKEMRCIMQRRDVEMQECYIAEGLDAHGVALIKSLYDFIILREEAK